MAAATKKMKEEFDLTNEILYDKKSKKTTEKKEDEKPKKSGKEDKSLAEKAVDQMRDEDEDLELEILTGKTVKPAKITKLSKEDQEDVEMANELLGNTSKKKKSEPAAEKGKEEKKPGKKFDRKEYFGL